MLVFLKIFYLFFCAPKIVLLLKGVHRKFRISHKVFYSINLLNPTGYFTYRQL